jgi:hypothetical protein
MFPQNPSCCDKKMQSLFVVHLKLFVALAILGNGKTVVKKRMYYGKVMASFTIN